MFWSKSKSSTNYSNEVVPVSKQDLNQLVNALSRNDLEQPIDLNISEESPLYPIVTNLNLSIKKCQDKAHNALMDINGRVERITGISSIRDMIRLIEKQTEHVNNMAAQAEEMSAAAEEIAAATNTASSFADQSLNTAANEVHRIKEAISLVDRSFADFEQTIKQVHDVLDSLGEIEQIVGLIAGIADQTDLLALNAAIEAARAGEQGKGFAVVADEVRKLAEHTKLSVRDIKQKMGVLNQKSSQTAQNISTVAQTMQEGKNIMQKTRDAIEQILEKIQAIADDISQIAAGNEEQSTTLQDFSQNVSELASSAEYTINYAREAGQGIFQIGQELIDLRHKRINQAQDFSIHDALEIYKTDHLCWTWRIYNMLLGYEVIEADQLDTHETCRLGQWLQSPQGRKLREIPGFEKLEEPHRRLHELGREAVIAYKNNESTKVENIFGQLTEASNELIAALNYLQSAVTK